MSNYLSGSAAEVAARAGISGGIGALGAMALGESMNSRVNFYGASVSGPTAVFGAVAAGSIANDLLGNVLLRYVPGGQYAKLVTGIGLTGGTTALVLNQVPQAQPGGWMVTGALGAASYAVADNLTNMWYHNGAGHSSTGW